MDRSPIFINLLLDLEGPQNNLAQDAGGVTKFGISAEFLHNYNPNLNIKDLTLDQAKSIYKSEFYDKVKQVDPSVSHYHLFDICVNSGYPAYVVCKTIAGANVNSIINWRKQKFQMIVDRNPKQEVFLKGWLNRLDKINQYFLKNKID